MSTYEEVLKYGRTKLREAEIEEWSVDSWQLMEFVSDKSRAWFYAHGDEAMLDEEEREYKGLLAKRIQHIPLQYLTGRAYFMGLEFHVNENVLIPRQDTEILVETVIPEIKNDSRILDMCTGSGCILLSILSAVQGVQGTGVDLSEKALEVARENGCNLGIPAEFIQSNLFENVEGIYDIIVSNPPYIPTKVIRGLMTEVKSHEPYMALDGHEDGLFFYDRIIQQAGAHLKTGGLLGFEIGHDQAASVSGMLSKAGYYKIKVIQDLAGLDRVVIGNK